MNKKDVITAKDLEKYYNECRKIRFLKDGEVELILKGVYLDISKLDIIFNKLIIQKYETFYIRGGNHCPGGRFRSIDNFIRICKYYIPNVKVSYILKYIYDLYSNNIKRKAGERILLPIITYCPDIRGTNFQSMSYYHSPIEKKYNTKLYNMGFTNCSLCLNDISEH